MHLPQAPAPTEFDLLAVPSAFRRFCGIRITGWSPGRCELELPALPHLLNNAGVLAGAVVGAAVDMAGSLAGCYSGDAQRRVNAVTISFTVAFLGAAAGPIRAVGVRKGGGRRIFTATVDVFNERGEVVATGQGSFRHIDPA